tara:strand:+ start:965 stop:1102 length:138 start_codon:yes stop_codon:yes gene_type:complete
MSPQKSKEIDNEKDWKEEEKDGQEDCPAGQTGSECCGDSGDCDQC